MLAVDCCYSIGHRHSNAICGLFLLDDRALQTLLLENEKMRYHIDLS